MENPHLIQNFNVKFKKKNRTIYQLRYKGVSYEY